MTIIRVALSGLVATGALVGAHALGGGHDPQAFLLAGVAAGALLHVPAQVIMSLTEAMVDGFERRLETGAGGDRPAMNEDLQRAGRKAALRGAKIALNSYIRSVQAAPYEHDVQAARKFRKAGLKWVQAQERQTRRQDRPEDGGWSRPGLGLEAVMRPASRDIRYANQIAVWEDLAWQELTQAMNTVGVATPERFRAFFVGAPNCGLGWRRAGHLVFMRILKRDHDAYVGFTVEVQTQILDEIQHLVSLLKETIRRPPSPTGSAPNSDKRAESRSWRLRDFWRAATDPDEEEPPVPQDPNSHN
jgi:hypothetical protein